MPITDGTFDNLSNSLQVLKLVPVERDEADQLLAHFGVEHLQRLIASAKQGDSSSKASLHLAILAIKMVQFIAGFRAAVDVDLMLAIVTDRGYPIVRATAIAASEGDLNATAVLDKWFAINPNGKDPTGSVEDFAGGALPTDVAPPQAEQSGPRQSSGNQAYRSSQEAQTRPVGPARPSQMQAYRSDPGGPQARTPARPVDGNNVRSLHDHRRERDTLDDSDLTSPDNAPPSERISNSRNNSQGESAERQYDQHCCYGKDIAVQFERTLNIKKTNNTVNFKIAKAKIAGRTCQEGVDWANAINLMLEPFEVQLMYAVMYGLMPYFRAAGHGRDNQKWLEIKETTDQWAGSIRLTVGHGSDIRNINFGHIDIKEVMELFSRTLHDQAKGHRSLHDQATSQDSMLMMGELRRVVDLYTKKQATKSNHPNGGGGGSGQNRSAR